MNLLNPILGIAYRDVLKLLRDPARIMATFIFPVIFIGILGGSLQASFAQGLGYSLLVFVFTGILAQTLFQSTALGIISLIADRENDFSQEIFVSPVSRYAIIFGKILGESMVALVQALGIIAFGLVLNVPLSLAVVAGMVPVALLVCLLGGAFGVAVMSTLENQQTANQVFPFIMFPQFFLAGVLTPIQNLPWYLDVASHLAPMRYAVDLLRGVYYAGTPEYDKIVLDSPWFNIVVIVAMFVVFLIFGTIRFVSKERNR